MTTVSNTQTRILRFLEKIASETHLEAPSALHSNITSRAIEHLFTNYSLPDNAMVLDAGCGQAVALKHFAERKCRPVGITLNMTDLEECRKLGYTVAQIDMCISLQSEGFYWGTGRTGCCTASVFIGLSLDDLSGNNALVSDVTAGVAKYVCRAE
jgi:hypothetical protein